MLKGMSNTKEDPEVYLSKLSITKAQENYLEKLKKTLANIDKFSINDLVILVFSFLAKRLKLDKNMINKLCQLVIDKCNDQKIDDVINKYIGVAKFLSDKDLRSDVYLPEKDLRNDWKSYLSSLEFDTIGKMKIVPTNYPGKKWIPPNRSKSNETYVTFLYDVEKILYSRTSVRSSDRGSHSSNMDYYFNRSKNLLSTDIFLYIMVNVEMYSYVYNTRKSLGLLDKTVIIPINISDSPYYYYKPLVNQCFNEDRVGDVLQNSDSFIYRGLFPIWWTKMKVIEKAIEDNYFDSNLFIWTDFGLMRTDLSERTPKNLKEIVRFCPSNKIKFLVFNTFSKNILNDRVSFYRNVRYTTCAGLISFPKILYPIFMNLWNEELVENLKLGYPSSEEQILSCIYHRNKKHFQLDIGDYYDILNSWSHMCTRYDIIKNFFKSRLNDMDWPEMSKNGEKFLMAVDKKTVNYTVEQILSIYNDLLICFWYSENKGLSRNVAILMSELLPFAKIDNIKRKHYIDNMSFHKIKPLKKYLKCIFTNDNNVVIYLPMNNDLITIHSRYFPHRDQHEVLFRRICTYMINENIIDKKKNIIDLGAWIGDNSLPWAKNIQGKVYAIDPSAKNCSYIELIKKISNISNVITIQEAIGDRVKIVSSDEIMEHCTLKEGSDGRNKFKTTTLDILYSRKTIEDIGFIHLDVEGMEWAVIQGAKQLISDYMPVVSFEQHINTDDYNLVVDYFKTINYKVFLINEILPGCKIDCRNFLAIPQFISRNIAINGLKNHLYKMNDLDNYGGELNFCLGHKRVKIYRHGNVEVNNIGDVSNNDIATIEYKNGELIASLNDKVIYRKDLSLCGGIACQHQISHDLYGIIVFYEPGSFIKNVKTFPTIESWNGKNVQILSNDSYIKKTGENNNYNSYAISANPITKIQCECISNDFHVRFGIGRLNMFSYLIEF